VAARPACQRDVAARPACQGDVAARPACQGDVAARPAGWRDGVARCARPGDAAAQREGHRDAAARREGRPVDAAAGRQGQVVAAAPRAPRPWVERPCGVRDRRWARDVARRRRRGGRPRRRRCCAVGPDDYCSSPRQRGPPCYGAGQRWPAQEAPIAARGWRAAGGLPGRRTSVVEVAEESAQAARWTAGPRGRLGADLERPPRARRGLGPSGLQPVPSQLRAAARPAAMRSDSPTPGARGPPARGRAGPCVARSWRRRRRLRAIL
jgi:hypothetical protein